MRQNATSKILFLTGIIASVLACSKDEPVVNATPVIQFKSITKFTREASGAQLRRDSVITTISFSDANGDLGEDGRDTTRIKQVFANQNWGNFEIRTLQFINGAFQEIVPPASTQLFVDLGNRNASKPISGTLDYSQKFAYQGNYKLVPVKFQIRLRDRNLNASNTVETDTISVPIAQ